MHHHHPFIYKLNQVGHSVLLLTQALGILRYPGVIPLATSTPGTIC